MNYRVKTPRPETTPYVPPACRLYEEARKLGAPTAELQTLQQLSMAAEAEARQWGIWQRDVDFDWYWDEYERFVQAIDLPVRGRC